MNFQKILICLFCLHILFSSYDTRNSLLHTQKTSHLVKHFGFGMYKQKTFIEFYTAFKNEAQKKETVLNKSVFSPKVIYSSGVLIHCGLSHRVQVRFKYNQYMNMEKPDSAYFDVNSIRYDTAIIQSFSVFKNGDLIKEIE